MNKNSLSIDINSGNDIKISKQIFGKIIINNYKDSRNSGNFSTKNKDINILAGMNNNNNNSPINYNDEKKFIRRNSKRKSTKKMVNTIMQNIKIPIDDLPRHLNFFEIFLTWN